MNILNPKSILLLFIRDTGDFVSLFKEKSYCCNKKLPLVINQGATKIIALRRGLKILWNNQELAEGIGLSVSVNTLGVWTDSSEADWLIIDYGKDNFTIKVIFKELPLFQIWNFKLNNEDGLEWNIYAEIEENLCVNEIRVSTILNLDYQIWSDGVRGGGFQPADGSIWQDTYLGSTPANIVGVVNKFLPAVIFESSGNKFNDLLPCVQNSPAHLKSRLIGFRRVDFTNKINYFACRRYHIFSGVINIADEKSALNLRLRDFLAVSKRELILRQEAKKSKNRPPRFLLTNLPWQNDGKHGVRAGSRWPHLRDNSEKGYMPFPFFLAYTASLLERHGIDVSIIDAIVEETNEAQFITNIASKDLDFLVAETSVPSLNNDLRILEKIKKLGISIILCGPCWPIYNPEFLKEHSFIDFVLCGEYEYVLLELIQVLRENGRLSRVKGLIYRDGDSVFKNISREPFDVNLLPWPHRETMRMDKYIDHPGGIRYPSVQMLASRGCPFGCSFCLWPQVMYQNGHYRARDIKDVVDEMEFLVKEKKFNSIYFDDDTFNVDKKRMLSFCKLIRERNLENIPWAIMARADLMDKEILLKMREAGLRGIKYGVESVDMALLKSCGKVMDIEKVTQMIKLTKELGIGVHLTFTFGLSGETRETALRTIDYALKLEPHTLQFSLLTPFPGTRLFNELENEGRILTKDWSLYDGNYNCVFKPRGVISRDLIDLKTRAYILWRKKQRGCLKRFMRYFGGRNLGCIARAK